MMLRFVGRDAEAEIVRAARSTSGQPYTHQRKLTVKFGNYFVLVAAAGLTVAGCKDKSSAPTADTAAATAAPLEARTARPKALTKGPNRAPVKLDPGMLKDYRTDTCFFESVALLHARDTYLASLGGAEPSLTKLPKFEDDGAEVTPVGRPPIVLKDDPAKDKVAATPRRRAMSSTARAARSCTVAANAKTPAVEGVDAAIAAFAPFATSLSNDLTEAETYYDAGTYKTDALAKGKELHKKLLAQFAQLDELQRALGVALQARPAAKPAAEKEENKLAAAAVAQARAAAFVVVLGKPTAEVLKAETTKLDQAIAALKSGTDGAKEDAVAKFVVPALEAYAKELAAIKVSAKGIDSGSVAMSAKLFTTVLQANQRASSRGMLTRQRDIRQLNLKRR